MSKVKLYVLPGSHPCAAVEVALQRKGDPVSARRPAADDAARGGSAAATAAAPSRGCASTASGWWARARSCAASTSWCPSRRCCPPTPRTRERVLEAERWGDRGLPERAPAHPRRGLPAQLRRDGELRCGDAKLPLPRAMLRPALPLTARLMARAQQSPGRACAAPTSPRCRASSRRSMRGSPRGCSGARSPTPPTCRSAPRSACCETIGDVRPLIVGHPAAALTRYFPPMVGEVPLGRCRRSGCRRAPRWRRTPQLRSVPLCLGAGSPIPWSGLAAR